MNSKPAPALVCFLHIYYIKSEIKLKKVVLIKEGLCRDGL